MTKLEKAIRMEMEGLSEKILESYCPHDYGLADRSIGSDFMCGSDCKACWNEEVEDDKN